MPVYGWIELLRKVARFAFSRRCAEFIFLVLAFMPVSRAEQSKNIPKHSRVRIYFLAADEVAWDYAPLGQDVAMGHEFHNLEADYMESGPHKIGRVYKKAVFREYTDARFNRLKPRSADEEYLGILGPVLYCEVGDTLKVVFFNHSSRPYSIHPHGVLYSKNAEGSGYDDGTSGVDKADDAVPPGIMHTYIWQVPERAGPGANDFSSVAWMYHSHVDELRDVASGLFGAIIVTARGKARPDGHPSDVDREVVSLMISINENESWYLDANIRKYTTDPDGVDKMETIPGGPDHVFTPGLGRGFADVNIRYTVNGYMFGNMPMITMKAGQRVRWYLLALGDSNNFHTPHWHGNSVTIRGHRTDVISLAPGQMETVDMIPDNPGIWLFHCHISDHMSGGMVTRYKVEP